MKRFLFLLSLFIVTVISNAQTVNFKISPTGDFISNDGNSYVIAQFPKSTAHELFVKLFSNVGEIYRVLKTKSIITIDSRTVTIRAYNSKIAYNMVNNQQSWLGSYYNLSFEIKDGRVKINAPIIDATVTDENGVKQKDFSKMIISYYPDGKLNSRYAQNVNYIETEVNKLINGVLTGVYINDENW